MGNSESIIHRDLVGFLEEDAAVDRLVTLARDELLSRSMSRDELLKITEVRAHTNFGEDLTLNKIVQKQLLLAKEIEKRVFQARVARSEEMKQKAKVAARFNDGDGDDIQLTMNKGILRVWVNKKELPVQCVVQSESVVRFSYTSGNTWEWTVDFKSRKCTGRSPRTFLDKHLSAVLDNDSAIQFE